MARLKVFFGSHTLTVENKSVLLVRSLFCIAVLVSTGVTANVTVYTEPWPPFTYAQKGEIKGVVTDNVRAILDASGLNYRLELYPWVRSYYLARHHADTLIYPIYRNPERENLFHWFCPVYPNTRLYLFKLAGSPIDHSSLDAVRDKVIGVDKESHSYQYLTSMGFEEGTQLDVITDGRTNVIKLQAGRVDLISQSETSLHYRAMEMGIDPGVFVRGAELDADTPKTLCLALNKGASAETLEAVTSGFEYWLTHSGIHQQDEG